MSAAPAPGRRPNAKAVRLFHLWENAEQLVPFKGLYTLVALPGRSEALKLEHLNRCVFVFRITETFVAQLAFVDGAFGPATLHAQSFTFRLTSMPGHFGLMPPEDAERLLELHLGRQERKFWGDFFFEINPGLAGEARVRGDFFTDHFRRLPWHSLRLEQPFGAGFGEPFYKFRKHRSRHEFWVGARSGDVRTELAADLSASVPQPPSS